MALQLQKVLISDSVDVSCREILESAGISVDSRPGLGKGDLLSIIKVCSWLRGGWLAGWVTWTRALPTAVGLYC